MQLKKDRTSKGEKFHGVLDANAINDKAVYCFAVYVATSHHTFIKKPPKKINGGLLPKGSRGIPLQGDRGYSVCAC